MAERIQLRRDVAANWDALNPILAQGEPGYDLDNDILKIGDGETSWNDLDDILPTALVAHINDTDNPHQVTAGQVGAEPAGTAASAVLAHEAKADPHAQYVQKIAGKGLSTNDYTDAEKTKLAGIAEEATKNRADSENADKMHTHVIGDVDGLADSLSDIESTIGDIGAALDAINGEVV